MRRATCLVVIVLLVLGCSAAFAQKSLVYGLLASDGVTQYCDYETLAISPPYAAGIHVLTGCGFPSDGTLVGFKGSILPVAHLPVTGGQTYLLADSSFDAICNCFTGEQIMWVTASIVNPKKPQFGWEYLYNEYESFSAYLGNWGYLTTTIPGDGPVANGPANRSGVSSIQHLIQNNNMMKK